jgi:hypothetical protein
MSSPITLDALNSQLWEMFPARAGMTSLELADTAAVMRVPASGKGTEDSLRIVMRLVVWDLREGDPPTASIRDVKEQEIYLGPASLLDRGERLLAFFAANHAVLEQLFATDCEVECLMPYELLKPDVLKLVRAQTADDFRQALMTKRRLGGLFPRS